MQDQYDASPDASAQDVSGPGEQAEGGQDPQKTNRFQRLKKQRDRAWQEMSDLKSKVSGLETMMREVIPFIKGQAQETQQPQSGTQWDNMPMDQYEQIISNEELWAEKPHVPAYALANYAKRLTANMKDKLREELTGELLGTVRQKDDTDKVFDRIRKEFGEDVLEEDHEVFQLANQKYIALQRKYGAEKVNEMPDYKYWVMKEAAQELGLQRVPEPTKIERTQPSAPAYSGPPPEERVEGGSEGIADAVARHKSLLSEGKWEEATRDIAKRLYPGR